MFILAIGRDAKKWTIERIYDNNRSERYAKGIDKVEEINPTIPVIKLKSIVSGIKGKIKIFTGRETIDKIPVEYRSIGMTAMVAEIVVATNSRNLNRAGKNFTHLITFGVINKTPAVAINDNWNDISVTTRRS